MFEMLWAATALRSVGRVECWANREARSAAAGMFRVAIRAL